jgi:hypothetical protein
VHRWEASHPVCRIAGPGGTLLLCHWRHPISGWELDGDGVHARARHRLGWRTAGLYRERDFVLETFLAPEPSSEAGSVEIKPEPSDEP